MEETNNSYNTQQQNQPLTLAEKLTSLRQSWSQEVESLNNDMVKLPTLDKLLNVVYTKRQQAVELYTSTLTVLNKQVRLYKQKYAEVYNNFKLGTNGIRYSNESSIQTQCEASLISEKEIIDELKTFTDYMWETVKTIDSLMYGIQHKMKIYEIQNGLKF